MAKLVNISSDEAVMRHSPFSLAVCDKCQSPNCCEIEPPFLTASDLDNISFTSGLAPDQFSDCLSNEDQKIFHQMKRGTSRRCIFYDKGSKSCSIYENRPLDCRLFPLDIVKIKKMFVWIMYTSCPVDTPLLKRAALEMVELAEKKLLPLLVADIEVYSHLPTQGFKSGNWLYVRELRY